MNIVHQLRAGGDPDLRRRLRRGAVARARAVARGDARAAAREVRRDAARPPPRVQDALAAGAAAVSTARPRTEGRALRRRRAQSRRGDRVDAPVHPRAHGRVVRPLEGAARGVLPADFASFYDEVAKTMFPPMLFGFVAAWWPLRHADERAAVHFSDMKADHEGSVRKIARFLGFEPTAKQWPKILEYTSFAWMKAHEDKFELRHRHARCRSSTRGDDAQRQDRCGEGRRRHARDLGRHRADRPRDPEGRRGARVVLRRWAATSHGESA